MQKITPNIMVADVKATVEYYQDNFSFEFINKVESLDGNLEWALIKKDNVELMFQKKESFVKELPETKKLKMGGTFTLYISMKDVKRFYETIKNKVDILKELHKTFYGADEFVIKDLNGYIIYFAEAQN